MRFSLNQSVRVGGALDAAISNIHERSIAHDGMKSIAPHLVLLLTFMLGYHARGETRTLQPSADTTLHQTTPDAYLGDQFDLAAGVTRLGDKTRALLRFDLKPIVPPNATITAAALEVKVTKQPSSGGANSIFELRRVLVPWAEATWKVRSQPSEAWSQPGGGIGTDFSSNISASIPISDRGSYTFATTPALVADVQRWLNKPDENFGWVLLSQAEATPESARRFGSREDPVNTANLTVEYTLTPSAEPIRITNITIQDGFVMLTWTGGQPPFQVQRRTVLNDGAWVAVGEATTNRSIPVPVEGTGAFYRVTEPPTAPDTAEYEVTFESTWSAASHPQSFPSGAHWSPLIGGTHNSNVTFWEVGGTATRGIEDLAELGNVVALRNEVNAAITAQTAFNVLSRPGSIPSAGTVALTFTMNRNFPLVTLVSMIAPSPDWFTGVHSLPLLENGQWRTSTEVILNLYDAGTDTGANYASLDIDTQPREKIRQIDGFPALVNGQTVPFAKMTFKRR